MATGRSAGSHDRGSRAPHGHIGLAARPSDRSAFVDRDRGEVPDGHERCPDCNKVVKLKANGLLRGHQASRGISCRGGDATCGS